MSAPIHSGFTGWILQERNCKNTTAFITVVALGILLGVAAAGVFMDQFGMGSLGTEGGIAFAATGGLVLLGIVALLAIRSTAKGDVDSKNIVIPQRQWYHNTFGIEYKPYNCHHWTYSSDPTYLKDPNPEREGTKWWDCSNDFQPFWQRHPRIVEFLNNQPFPPEGKAYYYSFPEFQSPSLPSKGGVHIFVLHPVGEKPVYWEISKDRGVGVAYEKLSMKYPSILQEHYEFRRVENLRETPGTFNILPDLNHYFKWLITRDD